MSAYSDRILADGASAYWRMNETSGTTASDSAGTRHATISGGVTVGQPGVVAGATAMLFPNDGLGKVLPATFPSLGSAFSLEVWAHSSVATLYSQHRVLMGKSILTDGECYWMVPLNTGDIRFYYFSGAYYNYVTPSVPWLAGEWKHLVMTAGGGQGTLYVNGVAQTPMAMATGGAGGVHGIGCDTEAGAETWGWRGKLQDFAIYPTVLTPAQISAHYTLQTTPAAPSVGPRDMNTKLMTYLCGVYGLTPPQDLTTLITRNLAGRTGDYTNRWKQMEQDAAGS